MRNVANIAARPPPINTFGSTIVIVLFSDICSFNTFDSGRVIFINRIFRRDGMADQIHANELAGKQKEIGVAEFFAKNRHLLGFDNKIKALMTTIKEAVDNALDACEEARILPEIVVEVTDLGDDRFKIAIEDNGPGIVEKQISRIFAKLLYGLKFHKLGQSR